MTEQSKLICPDCDGENIKWKIDNYYECQDCHCIDDEWIFESYE